jgi:RND family efflux transporter MFP subunit
VKLKILVIVALLTAGGIAVVASVGGLPSGDTTASTTYLTATAATGDVTDEVAATGTIAPAASYVLGFGTAAQLVGDATPAVGSGTWLVETVNVAVGDAVRTGDVLATASTTDLRRQLAVAQSSLAAARLGEKQARKVRKNASGTDEIRQAKIGVYNAVNSRRQAESDVRSIKDQITLATLVAPIDGTVTGLAIAPGLEATGTAITLASNDYEVTADVVESDISSMSIGQAATVTVSAIDAAIGGKVATIAPEAGSGGGSSSVVSFPVTVALTGGPTALRSGMTADITIVTASAPNVLTIPSAALRGTSGDYRVQVMAPDGTVSTTPVTVGLVTSTEAEVTSGLSAGDVVVTGINTDRIASTTTTSSGRGGFGGGVAIPGVGGGGRFQP